jgi:hypothetical protein
MLSQRLLGYLSHTLLTLIDAKESEVFLEQLTPWIVDGELERVGPFTDGGYVILKDSVLPDALISLGVGLSSEFEKHFADLGVTCILVDGTVNSPAINHENFEFENKLAGLTRRGAAYVSLESLINKYGVSSSRKLMAQIDIEGAEYETILSTPSATLGKFRQIVIECHDIASCLTPQGKRLWDIFFDHVSKTHTLIHTHANNCCPPTHFRGKGWPNVVELTFVRNDLIQKLGKGFLEPKPDLDADNNSEKTWRYF